MHTQGTFWLNFLACRAANANKDGTASGGAAEGPKGLFADEVLKQKKREKYVGSERPLPTLIKEKELWYRVP
jgi:hypothetical protein